MTWLTAVFVASIVSIAALSPVMPDTLAANRAAPSTCSVTVRPTPAFFAPPPYPQSAPGFGSFWYGSDALWTMLGDEGAWPALPRNAEGFRQKVFWWSRGFDGRTEGRPNLTVVGRRLDGPESFTAGPATNARHDDFGGWTILTGVDVPTSGCWELTATYRGQSLAFVIWIPATTEP